ncbi:hypothetical protein RYH80_17115 [Halobaculum sp. MBLA0147]|uniref:hypothetical protein n=1 Tax=Halobaculum sp. MBLA0147 TaxID=3079934 RepID=UPI0035249C29
MSTRPTTETRSDATAPEPTPSATREAGPSVRETTGQTDPTDESTSHYGELKTGLEESERQFAALDGHLSDVSTQFESLTAELSQFGDD